MDWSRSSSSWRRTRIQELRLTNPDLTNLCKTCLHFWNPSLQTSKPGYLSLNPCLCSNLSSRNSSLKLFNNLRYNNRWKLYSRCLAMFRDRINSSSRQTYPKNLRCSNPSSRWCQYRNPLSQNLIRSHNRNNRVTSLCLKNPKKDRQLIMKQILQASVATVINPSRRRTKWSKTSVCLWRPCASTLIILAVSRLMHSRRALSTRNKARKFSLLTPSVANVVRLCQLLRLDRSSEPRCMKSKLKAKGCRSTWVLSLAWSSAVVAMLSKSLLQK